MNISLTSCETNFMKLSVSALEQRPWGEGEVGGPGASPREEGGSPREEREEGDLVPRPGPGLRPPLNTGVRWNSELQ